MRSLESSAACRLWNLLEVADEQLPHGTKKIRVDGSLCVKVARETGLDAADLFEVFGPDPITRKRGRPVRQMFHIVRWVQTNAPGDVAEQTEMLLRWGARHNPKATPLREVS